MKWKKILAAVAPTLATALGGPLAGMATKAVAGAVLGNENAKEAEIEAAIVAGGPDVLVKLKEADNAFQVRMAELGIELEKIAAQDRDSARQRQVAMKDHTPTVLAYLTVAGFMATQVWLLGNAIPIDNKDAVNRALGILDAVLMLVIGYYFGSSRGSAAKDETMREALKGK